jgi:hypothetical protein
MLGACGMCRSGWSNGDRSKGAWNCYASAPVSAMCARWSAGSKRKSEAGSRSLIACRRDCSVLIEVARPDNRRSSPSWWQWIAQWIAILLHILLAGRIGRNPKGDALTRIIVARTLSSQSARPRPSPPGGSRRFDRIDPQRARRAQLTPALNGTSLGIAVCWWRCPDGTSRHSPGRSPGSG